MRTRVDDEASAKPGQGTLRYGGDVRLLWYWEGNVQEQFAKYLVAEGWTIEQYANTAERQKGIDLVATKDQRRLVIEVKGFPGTVYARGPMAGQAKPTQPRLQAGHWFASALHTAACMRSANRSDDVALVFPDNPRYRDLLGRVEYAIERLELRVFICREDGAVEEIPAGARQR